MLGEGLSRERRIIGEKGEVFREGLSRERRIIRENDE